MKVLVIGSGGREHALCWAIGKSPILNMLFCAPGNGGIKNVAKCVDISPDNIPAIVDFATSEEIDLVVIGPEAPLVAGLANCLEASGIRVFGPNANAAMIEGSKGMMKDLCAKYNIPTANYSRFNEINAAKEYIRGQGAPIVVKADGLAAGKGVILCHNKRDAYAAVDEIMVADAFGEAGGEIVIEDFMFGEEASFFAIVDGKKAVPMAAAQDHKAVGEGDVGPNTGGMGAYSPAPVVDEAMTEKIMDTIINPTIQGMAAEGITYKGVLFAGLMITKDGPKLIEYNCRFGDPECQALMMRLESDLLQILIAAADGVLEQATLKWSCQSALTVVMAANGYPGNYERGSEIKGIEDAELAGATIFHAGTTIHEGKVLANGGRVLNITALAPEVAEAQEKAYRALSKIDWTEGFFRSDIGWRAIGR